MDTEQNKIKFKKRFQEFKFQIYLYTIHIEVKPQKTDLKLKQGTKYHKFTVFKAIIYSNSKIIYGNGNE